MVAADVARIQVASARPTTEGQLAHVLLLLNNVTYCAAYFKDRELCATIQ